MTFTAANLCQQYQAALLLSAKSVPENEISRVYCTDDKYEVKLSIQNFFLPEEISVKAVDNYIIVEGKHETKGEKLGLISHQLTRRYVLPPGVDKQNISCTMGNDGVLTLSAPRKVPPAKEVVIPISKSVENLSQQKDVQNDEKLDTTK